MGIADGKGIFRKIAFELDGKFFRFAINPDNMVYSRPHRTTATKTKSRIVVSDFQDDIHTVTISGTTGLNPTGVAADRGIAKIREMKNFLENYASLGGNGNKSAADFYFHDFTNAEHYVVHLSPEGVNFTQDANSPLTHRYDIKFIILRKAGEPDQDDVVDPEIGNRFPTLPDGTGLGGVGNSGVGSGAQDSSGETSDDKPYDPASGNDSIYNKGSGSGYQNNNNTQPVNPQAPSPSSSSYGQTGLGYALGYYLRNNGGGR
jgi:hypothetical protein